MEIQPDLFGGGAVRTRLRSALPLHRYYFTLLPPPAVAQDMEYLALQLSRRYGARNPVRASRAHVSLTGVGQGDDLPPDRLDAALDAGDAIQRPRFDVCFDRVVTFGRADHGGRGRQRATVLTCSTGTREIEALYADLRRELIRKGVKNPPNTTPHLTLWYATGAVSELVLPRPFRWSVRQFWLVRTTLGEARPECLGEWRLGR
jgi:2'-5' RNA ligase